MTATTLWTLTRNAGPANRPVSVTEAKASLRLAQSDTTHDDLLTDAIDGATEQFEQDADQVVITQEFLYKRSTFPRGGGSIAIPIRPVDRINKIEYVDPAGATVELDTADYEFDSGRRQIHLSPGKQWPTTISSPNAVIVELLAGYGSSSASVPRMIKQAILLQVGKWFTDPVMESNDIVKLDKAYWNLVDKLSSTGFPTGETA